MTSSTQRTNSQQAAWDNLLKNTPTQTTVPYDSAGISRYLADFSRSLNNVVQGDPTDFTPQGMSSWLGVNYDNVDAKGVAADTLAYNKDNMPAYARMAGDFTQADTSARMTQLDRMNPNWTTERDQASAVNQSWMSGELSKDVQDNLQRNQAFSSLMSGSYGGGNARNATARDLGRTSMDIQAQGQEGAMKWQSMLGQLLPQVTSAAGVMESQGLSTKDSLATSLSNAQQQLSAQTTNAAGLQQSAEFNINAQQRGKELSSRENLGYAGMQTDGAARLMEAGTTAIQNRYASDVNASNTLFANMWRPFIMSAERLGNVQGQTSSRPYGI